MSISAFSDDELVAYAEQLAFLTPLETELLSRFQRALDEIDALTSATGAVTPDDVLASGFTAAAGSEE